MEVMIAVFRSAFRLQGLLNSTADISLVKERIQRAESLVNAWPAVPSLQSALREEELHQSTSDASLPLSLDDLMTNGHSPHATSASAARRLASTDDINFKNVSFRYNDVAGDVVKNFSLTIKAGTVCALIGPSGSGKTSVCNLLTRFYDPNEGAIDIGGVNIADFSKREWNEAVCAFVPQNSQILPDTVAKNIAFGSESHRSRNEIEHAARLASAAEFIEELPEGFDTHIGPGRLSGGQQQLIAIARAFLSQKPLLVMDEPSSSLDSHSEKLFQEALYNLRTERTCLLIAHRLHTVVHADMIACMHNGEVVEQGKHSELLNKGGLYSSMVDAQHHSFA